MKEQIKNLLPGLTLALMVVIAFVASWGQTAGPFSTGVVKLHLYVRNLEMPIGSTLRFTFKASESGIDVVGESEMPTEPPDHGGDWDVVEEGEMPTESPLGGDGWNTTVITLESEHPCHDIWCSDVIMCDSSEVENLNPCCPCYVEDAYGILYVSVEK